MENAIFSRETHTYERDSKMMRNRPLVEIKPRYRANSAA